MAASEQLVVMYTAGYLQIQHIVERGMDLMFKANSPHCDSQTAGSLEETCSEPQSPSNNGNGLAVAALLGTPGWPQSLLLSQRKIKLEGGEPTPLTIPSIQSKISSSELGSRLARASSLFYTTAGGNPVPGLPTYHLQGAGGGGAGGGLGVERSSPGSSSLPTTDSPTSYQNEDEEFEEEPYDGMTEDAYSHLYGRSANPYGSEYFVNSNSQRWNLIHHPNLSRIQDVFLKKSYYNFTSQQTHQYCIPLLCYTPFNYTFIITILHRVYLSSHVRSD